MKKMYKSIKLFIVLLCIATVRLMAQPLSGLYTINSGAATGGTNYQTFSAFAASINTAGVSGPVTVNVVAGSGPYAEQPIFFQTAGASNANRVTINGNGQVLTFNSTNASMPHTLLLNGADYMTFNDLNVIGQGATYALVTVLTGGANYNIFNNCTFTAPQNGTSSAQTPFAITSSSTSPTSSGTDSGNNNSVISCTVANGYYGLVAYGLTSAPYQVGNSVINTRITDVYYYSMYFPYSKNMTIQGCTIDRMTRTATPAHYAVYGYQSQGLMFEGNKIHKLCESNQNVSAGIYCVYNYGHPIANGLKNTYRNNIITDIKNNSTVYGFYVYSSNSDVYNNTVDLDYSAASAASTIYGFYAYGSAGFPVNIYNNIITINRGGTGASRYGIYNALTGFNTVDRNVISMSNANVVTYQNYYGSVANSLVAWQAMGCDVNGFSVTPTYSNQATGDMRPSNVAIDNAASQMGLLYDYAGAVRNQVTPDIGALEFLTPACVGVPSIGGITSPTFAVCPGAKVDATIFNPASSTGITIQWQTSNLTQVGPWTSAPNGTNVAFSIPSVTATTWINAIVTCSNSNQSTNVVAQINVAGTTTNTVPYFESFEGIGLPNRLPNCSWSANDLGGNCLTYTSATLGAGAFANSGSAYGRFAAASGTNVNYFYSNGIQLNAGVTYSASIFYVTESSGNVNWTDLSLLVGNAQTPAGLVSIASTGGPASSPSYKLLSNTFSVATSGLYYVAIKATNNGAASPYLTIDDLQINAPCDLAPNSPSIVVTGPSVICSGQSLNLSANGASSYTWSTGSNNASVTASPNISTSYIVSGKNALSGCVSSVTKNVGVNQSPVVSIVANPNTTICNGNTLNLSAVGATSYTWNNTTNATNISVTPSVTTTYTLVGSLANGCSGNVTQVVTVNPKPTVTAAASSTNVCLNDVTTLTGGGAVSYQWVSSSISLQGSPVNVSPNVTTTYTVTGIDANGCVSTDVVQLTVNICLGVNAISANTSDIKLYPNPNNGEFTVEFNNNSNKTVSVLDVTGRVIYTSTTNDDKLDLNINKFAAGIYYVKVQTNNSTEVLKVVKQ